MIITKKKMMEELAYELNNTRVGKVTQLTPFAMKKLSFCIDHLNAERKKCKSKAQLENWAAQVTTLVTAARDNRVSEINCMYHAIKKDLF